MRTNRRLDGVLVATLFLPACSYRLVTPPARIAPLESARTVAHGETAVHGGVSVQAAGLDSEVATANVRVRQGVSDSAELGLDVNWGRVLSDGLSSIGTGVGAGVDSDLYVARVGGKLGLNKNIALLAGIGGGYAPAVGGFTSADAGAIFSYDNCRVVPFFSAAVFGSVPIGVHDVEFRTGSNTIVSSAPTTSFGYSASTGLEIPLQPALCREGRLGVRLGLGISGSQMVPSAATVVTKTDGTNGTTTDTSSAPVTRLGWGVGLTYPF
jgi:hypothetical protein